MYYKVTLLNDYVDKSTADIVPYNQMDGTVTTSVYSDNVKMKNHLESLLQTEAYILAPGKFGSDFFSDGVLVVYPNTIEFLQSLPEILSWVGYNCVFVGEAHKSIHLLDLGFFVTKSSSDIHYNSDGERIVRRVPSGYIAVHTDGRTVAAGGWINANIDKEDADWSLVENPYETMSPEDRSADKENMDMYLQEYHPGADEGLYQERAGGEYYYTDYKPSSAKRLSEVFYEPETESVTETESASTDSFLAPGRVLYSPSTGYAILSENWPPQQIDGYEKLSWYVFDTLDIEDTEKQMYAEITGLTPQLIAGLQGGLVQAEKNLDISSGFKLSLPGQGNLLINPMSPEKLTLDIARDAEYASKYKLTSEIMSRIKSMTSKYNEATGKYEVSEEAGKIPLDDLNGMYANFVLEPFNYQRPAILALTEESQYEIYGGPRGWHGQFLNFTYGLGKTAIVTAAEAVMRNRGRFKVGEQVTIVTAPNKNVYVWQSEIAKFRNEDAMVIDGDRETRTAQWEELIKKAQLGTLPNMIVLGSSKFRYASGEEEDLLGIDAQYMKLLALGGSYKDNQVVGGHVSALVIDESGQYVNPGSSRHAAVQEVIESVYQGRGLTWTLNGDISGNSASDTVSEMSFINKIVRDNYNAVVHEYTKKDHDVQQTRSSKEVGRRVWKDVKRMNEFTSTFRPQIYTLNGQTIAGEKYGLTRTTDLGAELGATWGKIYLAAERKLSSLAEGKKMKKALGLMSVLTQASLGAVNPARLIEYDLGVRDLLDTVGKLLKPTDYAQFREELSVFRDRVTEDSLGVGILPKAMDIGERNSLYNSIFSETSRAAMERAVFSWDSPILDSIVDGIDFEITNQVPGEPPKIGVAGFSKVAMNAVYKKLLEKYGDKAVIQIIDGDTEPEEVSVKQKRHQRESGRPVITIVTSAGLYGLSLPSTRSFRLVTWNSAKAGQYEGRFHRDPEQENLVTVAVPDGICQYMREVEQKKRQMELETRSSVLSGNPSEDEDDIDEQAAMSFLKRMSHYRPRIRGEESGLI